MGQRKTFILKYAKALLSLGAPTHRIEGQLQSAAEMLNVPAQFILRQYLDTLWTFDS
jgi:uncharacterized membrane protein YjjP (DUF1212 family)